MKKDVGASQRAISAARMLDRLSPGEYIIRFVKPANTDGAYWSVDIAETSQVLRKTIGKTDRHIVGLRNGDHD